MIIFTAEFRVHDTQAAINEVEHIAQLMAMGYKAGVDWDITGFDEKEPVHMEEPDDENDTTNELPQ